MLHIVSPVSRPENISKMLPSIKNQIGQYNHPITWHLVLDAALSQDDKSYIASQLMFEAYAKLHHSPHNKALAGHAHRNFFLDTLAAELKEDNTASCNYVYFLDDDTILHPEFLHTITPVIEVTGSPVILFNQAQHDGKMRLYANPDMMKVGHIDTGMFMFNFAIFKPFRFIEDDYCADGHFAEALCNHYGPTNCHHVNTTLSFYNYLRPN